MNIPDYLEIIKQPMDLGTIQKNIEEHVILSRDDFAAAVRLVFDNAFKYNKPGDDVCVLVRRMKRRHVMAKTLSDLFEKDYMQINRRIFELEPEPASPVYSNKVPKHASVSKPKPRSAKSKAAKSAKGKKSANHHSAADNKYEDMVSTVMMLQNKVKMMEEQLKGIKSDEEEAVDDNRPMTVEEKKELSQEINKLSGENLQQIVNIIEMSQPLDKQGAEIEIDLDKIPNETLRRMQDFVKQCELNEGGGARKARLSYDMSNEAKLAGNVDPFTTFNSDSGGRVGVVSWVENSVNQDFF